MNEKKFLSTICRILGHNIFKDANDFADICTRCGYRESWMDKFINHKKKGCEGCK